MHFHLVDFTLLRLRTIVFMLAQVAVVIWLDKEDFFF